MDSCAALDSHPRVLEYGRRVLSVTSVVIVGSFVVVVQSVIGVSYVWGACSMWMIALDDASTTNSQVETIDVIKAPITSRASDKTN